MALTDQQQSDLLAAVARLDAAFGMQGPTTGKIDTILQDVTDIRGGVAGLPIILATHDPADIAAAIPAAIAQAVIDGLAKRLAQ